MKKLEKGCIYRFKYLNYNVDKYPLALILYAGPTYVHALNLSYLTRNLRAEVIDMITKIATKQMEGRDTYALYHKYIKKKLPRVIRFCYRKYFTHLIHNEQMVSRGFWHTRDFLYNIKKFSEKDKNKVFKDIRDAIKVASNEKQQDQKLRKLRRLALTEHYKNLTSKDIHVRASDYLAEINKVYNQKFQRDRYTF